MAKAICPICEKLFEIRTVIRPESTAVKGIKVTADSLFSVCTECGEEFATADQMETTLENAYSAYREQQRILSPDAIVEIRTKYGASQKAFAKILGLGELTINSYEQGSLPSKSVSNLIELMKHESNFAELFDRNVSKLSEAQVRKIQKNLTAR